MAFMANIMGLGLLSYILLGFRYRVPQWVRHFQDPFSTMFSQASASKRQEGSSSSLAVRWVGDGWSEDTTLHGQFVSNYRALE